MMKRIYIILIAVLLLALGVSCFGYVPEARRGTGVFYMSTGEVFVFAVYVYTIFFMTVGLPVSWLVDKGRFLFKHRTSRFQYVIGFSFYLLSGLIAGLLYHCLSGSRFIGTESAWEALKGTMTYWAVAALVYFHVSWLIENQRFKKK